MARLTFAQAKAAIDGSEEHALTTGLAMLVSGEQAGGTLAGGAFGYKAGAAGTVHVPSGAAVGSVSAQAGSSASSVVINGGDSIPVAADSAFDADLKGGVVGPVDVVFTGTVAYYVDWVV